MNIQSGQGDCSVNSLVSTVGLHNVVPLNLVHCPQGGGTSISALSTRWSHLTWHTIHKVVPLESVHFPLGGATYLCTLSIRWCHFFFLYQCRAAFFSRIDSLLGGLEWEVESTTVTHSSGDWCDVLLPLA